MGRAGRPDRPWFPRAVPPSVDPHPIAGSELELTETSVDDILLRGLGGRSVDGPVDDRVHVASPRSRESLDVALLLLLLDRPCDIGRLAHGGRAAAAAAVVQPGQQRRSMESAAARRRHSEGEDRREPGEPGCHQRAAAPSSAHCLSVPRGRSDEQYGKLNSGCFLSFIERALCSLELLEHCPYALVDEFTTMARSSSLVIHIQCSCGSAVSEALGGDIDCWREHRR